MTKGYCPICEQQVALTAVDPASNYDPMGRPQFICNESDGDHRFVQVDDKGTLQPSMEGAEWNSNLTQFPRLLGEIWGVGLTEDQYKSLSESMGLESERIDDLFERADYIWQRDKELTFRPKSARWILQGSDELYLKDTKTQRVITIPADFPETLARHIAQEMLTFLNTDARTR